MRTHKDKAEWQMALVVQPIAVKSPNGVQLFNVDQVIDVPKKRVRDLQRRGYICPLVFSLDPWQIPSASRTELQ